MLTTNSPCEIQRALLAEYMALLEKVRATQLERAEVLRPSMDSAVIKLYSKNLRSSAMQRGRDI
jgi:hypothetical protein